MTTKDNGGEDQMQQDKPEPHTRSTFCTVCNCVLWVETVDAHMKADHPDAPLEERTAGQPSN